MHEIGDRPIQAMSTLTEVIAGINKEFKVVNTLFYVNPQRSHSRHQ